MLLADSKARSCEATLGGEVCPITETQITRQPHSMATRHCQAARRRSLLEVEAMMAGIDLGVVEEETEARDGFSEVLARQYYVEVATC